MRTTGPGASRCHHARARIEAAIVRAETDLTLKLEHLERRRTAGRDCAVAEEVVRSIRVRLDTLHLRRDRILQAEAEEWEGQSRRTPHQSSGTPRPGSSSEGLTP